MQEGQATISPDILARYAGDAAREVEGVHALSGRRGVKVEWVNCGLCVDERGVSEAIEGTRRGSPADLWSFIQKSDNTLVIPTR